ncbi:MAG: fibronectin type III domain-containing protein, partial [Gemmatimonadota bacterium]
MKWMRHLALAGLLTTGPFLVTGCGDDGPSGPEIPDPPATPAGLAAMVDVFEVTVSWDASTGADEYDVSLSAEGEDDLAETTSGTSVVFTGLTGRTTYTASVVAKNQGGSSTAASTSVTTGSLNQIFFETAEFNNLQADPGFDPSVFEFGTQGDPPDFTLAAMPAGYSAATIPTAFDATNLIAPTDGRTLVNTDYAGAIAPGTSLTDAWYHGWTVWAESGEDSRDIRGLPTQEVDDDILVDTRWTNDRVWVLTQPIFVGVDCGGDGSKAGCVAATLTIDPGTTIVGKSDIAQGIRGAYLIVSRGSRLVADATPGVPLNAPRRPTEAETIVFTSDKDPGSRAVEDWGGLIINGQAPTNAGEDVQGEGDAGFYGGPDVNDDSGIIRGVRIEYAGDDVTPADQLNGLALEGVGAGTTISYVQIHYNKDDGIEPFGGTVSVDHLVVTGIGDDSVDGTDGYRGFMQFIIGQQNGKDADQGFEISNNGDDEDATPKSTAIIANATMIGASDGVVTGGIAGAESDNGIQLREGTNYRVYNSI